MGSEELKVAIHGLIGNIEILVPHYLENEEDRLKANGNVAVCLIDPDGQVYGKIFGDDKMRGREAFRVAWIKASQVWITGIKTGEYEKLVFSNQLAEDPKGIRKPDFIGWDGGQPINLWDGTALSVGFSGFRGEIDLEIVFKALARSQNLITS